jgi:hypothetical protein
VAGPLGRVTSLGAIVARARSAARVARAARARRGVEASLVWMLGSPRTGSTWLLNLLGVDRRVARCNEPAIGAHLGLYAADVMGMHPTGFDASEELLADVRRDDVNYFFTDRFQAAWRPHLRRMLLDRLALNRGPEARVLVLKEPTGSQAAEMLFRTLPRSKLLFLVRDARDVIDSELDAVQKGGWLATQFGSADVLEGEARLTFMVAQAHRWASRTEAVLRAYDAHRPDLRFQVRYEDLRADPFPHVAAILTWLDVPVAADALRRHVETLAFEALPAEAKGSGRFARAAAPGLWRENLTPEEQRAVTSIVGPTLRRLGYEVDA